MVSNSNGMDRFRQCLLQSTTKQSDFIEIFSAFDRDCSGRITLEEFRTAIRSLKIGVTMDDEIKRLFQQFDTTQNGQIDLKEFLQQLRPPMSSRRERAAMNVFNTMDSNQDGRLTVADLKTKLATTNEKKRSNEELDRILENFLKKFETPGQEDGVIDRDEFLGFCSMLSATIKDDIYFEHVLRHLFDFRF